MRIVYFLPDIDAGVATIVKALMKYKPVSDDHYAVVLFSKQEDKTTNIIADFEGPDEIIRFSYSSKENVYSVYKRLARNVLHSAHDIIVANDGWEIRMVVALKLTNPLVYILHGDFNYYYTVSHLNQGVIDLFIAYSSKVYHELTQHKLDKTNSVKVQKIYYPSAALAHYHPVVKEQSLPLKILFAGTLDERKGAHLLYEIYDGLCKKVVSFTLTIIGDGPLRTILDKQFRHSPDVIQEGWKSNSYILEKMRHSDVFLFPSFLEGLPNVLVEALSTGAVPVASDLESGVGDVIQDRINGILVKAGDVAGYINAIKSLDEDRTCLQKMSEQGQQGLKEKFDTHGQAALYDQAIKEVGRRESLKLNPSYSMGRWLNKSWLPNFLVIFIRSLIRHPKI